MSYSFKPNESIGTDLPKDGFRVLIAPPNVDRPATDRPINIVNDQDSPPIRNLNYKNSFLNTSLTAIPGIKDQTNATFVDLKKFKGFKKVPQYAKRAQTLTKTQSLPRIVNEKELMA